MISPGKLNKKVTIMELAQIPDGGGGYENKLQPFKKVWANVSPLYGKEFWQAQQTQAQVTHKVTIRYTKEVNRSHIISFNDKNYDIQYIINIDEANRFLQLHILERQ